MGEKLMISKVGPYTVSLFTYEELKPPLVRFFEGEDLDEPKLSIDLAALENMVYVTLLHAREQFFPDIAQKLLTTSEL